MPKTIGKCRLRIHLSHEQAMEFMPPGAKDFDPTFSLPRGLKVDLVETHGTLEIMWRDVISGSWLPSYDDDRGIMISAYYEDEQRDLDWFYKEKMGVCFECDDGRIAWSQEADDWKREGFETREQRRECGRDVICFACGENGHVADECPNEEEYDVSECCDSYDELEER